MINNNAENTCGLLSNNDFGTNSYRSSALKDYIRLTKPGVMSLAVFTHIIGIIIAPHNSSIITIIVSIISVIFGAASCASLNMWYDRDIDSVMTRTRNRPIVVGSISANSALEFGVMTGFLSIFLMAVCVNYLSALILLLSILSYIILYTVILKRSTPQNIVIGGISGALPPLIGWTSVTNSINVVPVLLVCIIFFWTPVHFWALALYRDADYIKAKIPMMPSVYGHIYTKKQMFIYAILTGLSGWLLCFYLEYSVVYICISNILSFKLIYDSYKLLGSQNLSDARSLFKYSIIYLFLIFGVTVI